MTKSKRISPSTEKVDDKKPRLPPGELANCRKCIYGKLHQWKDGSLKDPLIAQCTARTYNNYAVAESYSCKWFEYYPQYKSKVTTEHNKVRYSPANKL